MYTIIIKLLNCYHRYDDVEPTRDCFLTIVCCSAETPVPAPTMTTKTTLILALALVAVFFPLSLSFSPSPASRLIFTRQLSSSSRGSSRLFNDPPKITRDSEEEFFQPEMDTKSFKEKLPIAIGALVGRFLSVFHYGVTSIFNQSQHFSIS